MVAIVAPAGAQSASGRMVASVSVVAPVRVDNTAVAVSRSGAEIDVTRPLAVEGSAPWVLEVVVGATSDQGTQRLAVRRSIRSADSAAEVPTEPVTIRLPASAASDPERTLTYVVATVN